MADKLIAKYIGNGDKTAYIMDSIKVEQNKIVLYNSLDDTFKSEAPLPDFGGLDEPIHGRHNIDEKDTIEGFYTDCTEILNQLIAWTLIDGGGVIKFGTGVYNLRYINLPAKVRLEGSGMGSTILRRIPNGNTENTITDSLRHCKGFINIPDTGAGVGISNLSIYGGSSYTANGSNPSNMVYSDSSQMNGIFIYDTVANAVMPNGNPVDSYEAISKNEVTFEGNKTRKFIDINNVSIFGMYGSGIYVGTSSSDVHIDNVNISQCRYDGITMRGSNNVISNVILFGNGENGIYDDGNYNHYSNIDVQYTGMYDHYSAAGINLKSCIGTSVNNALVKSSYCDGYHIFGTGISVSNSVSDANGAASSKDPNITSDVANPKDSTHITMRGANHDIRINVINTSAVYPIARYVFDTPASSGSGYYNYPLKNSIITITAQDTMTSNIAGGRINDVTVSAYVGCGIVDGGNIVTFIPGGTYTAPYVDPHGD